MPNPLNNPTRNLYVDPDAGAIIGKYQLLELLGKGGIGQVWKAQDQKNGRMVAVKLLPAAIRDSQEAVALVSDAFRVVHSLTHEAICKTIDMDDHDRFGPYVVLDFVQGITLTQYAREYRNENGKIPVAEVVRLLEPIARALDYAHSRQAPDANENEPRGVLHRDVKPDNILVMLDSLGHAIRTVLIDFGLAAEIRNTVTRHTQGEVDTRGTPTYMAPEQLRGKRRQWDGRTDEYGLGVVAYELLAGHPPFEADDDATLRDAIKTEPADPVPGLSTAVNAALLRALAKERDERFESCSAFVAELERSASAPIVAPPPKLAIKSPPKLLIAPFDAAAAQRAQAEWADFLGQTVERNNSIGMPFVLIPPGEFQMGSTAEHINQVLTYNSAYTEEWGNDEQPRHRVRVTKPFYLGKHMVTLGQFAEFARRTHYQTQAESSSEGSYGWGGKEWTLDKNKNWRSPGFNQSDEHPVVCVSWNDAQAFLNWISKQENCEYALATEAQWEYACRAGTTTWHYLGDNPDDLAKLGNVADAAAGEKFPAWNCISARDGYVYTSPVGSFQPNAFGAYDMIGNAWEWCLDCYADDWYACSPTDDPRGPDSAEHRVDRGGGFAYDASGCRSALRDWSSPGLRFNVLGFRLALSPVQVSE